PAFPSRSVPALKQLSVALPGTKQHAVEVQVGQLEVAADVLLVLVGDVIAGEDLAVAVVLELRQHAAHGRRTLPGEELRELPGRRIGGGLGRLRVALPLLAPSRVSRFNRNVSARLKRWTSSVSAAGSPETMR